MAQQLSAVTIALNASTQDYIRKIKQLQAETEKSLGGVQKDMRRFERQMRQVTSNVGYQVSDMAVQMQGGIQASVILAQQGGQLLGAISPLAGAFITVAAVVGGDFINALWDTTSATKEFEKAQESLNEVLGVSKYGVFQLNDALVELYKTDKALAELTLETAILKAEEASAKARDAILEYSDEIKDLGKTYGFFNKDTVFQDNVEDLAGKLGLSTEQVLELNKAYRNGARSGGDLTSYANLLAKFALDTPTATRELKNLALQVQDTSVQAEIAEKNIDRIRNTLNNLGEEVENITKTSFGSDALITAISADDIAAENALIKKEFEDIQAIIKQTEQNTSDARLAQLNNQLLNIEAAKQKELQSVHDKYTEEIRATEEYEALLTSIKAKYDQQAVDAKKKAQDQAIKDQQAAAQAELQVYSNLASSIGSTFETLGENSETFAKVAFVAQQASAFAQAIINANLAYTNALANVPAPYNTAVATAALSAGYASAGVIAGTTIASFDTGTSQVPKDGLAMIHENERILTDDQNRDLSEFLVKQKSGQGMGGGTTVHAPLNIPSGAIIDPIAFEQMLVRHRNTVAGAVRKVEKERPNSKRR